VSEHEHSWIVVSFEDGAPLVAFRCSSCGAETFERPSSFEKESVE